MSFPGTAYISDAEARSTSSNQKALLGQRGVTPDRRSFVYCKNGSVALLVGKLVGQMTNDASLDADQDLATSTLYQDELSTATSVIYVKPVATEVIAADLYKEGYLYVNNELGEGQYLNLAGNDFLDGTVSVLWPIYLAPDSRLGATLSTATLIGLIENLFKNVVYVGPDTTANQALGVTVNSVTASYYFWAQTWGPCVIWHNLAATAGKPVSYDTFSGSGTAASLGAVHAPTSSTATITSDKYSFAPYIVGTVMAAAATTEHTLINLKISP